MQSDATLVVEDLYDVREGAKRTGGQRAGGPLSETWKTATKLFKMARRNVHHIQGTS